MRLPPAGEVLTTMLLWLLAAVPTGAEPSVRPAAPHRLTAHRYDSGFEFAHNTFNGISAASDGLIYYVLCSDKHDVGAQMYVFDPAARRIRRLGDLTEACGEKGRRTIVQGKSHVSFVEAGGKLYFATHLGYYAVVDGVERVGIPPEGWKPYPGGHLLAYDMASGRFEDLAIEPHGEGIITMNMDVRRGRIFGLTWPTGYFVRFNLADSSLKTLGAFFEKGEAGEGATFRVICRAIAVDPGDGAAYFTLPSGEILRYRPETDAVEPVKGDDLRKDYFGVYDATQPGHMGYHWRQTIWYEPQRLIYAVHGNSGYLFSFDPQAGRVELLDRITSEPSRRSGMFDQFNYGYLGFTLGPDGRTLYYLTGGRIEDRDLPPVATRAAQTAQDAKRPENLHLVTYDIPTAHCIDHGPIFFDDGQRVTGVNSIAVGHDGTVYALARVADDDRARFDLISIAPVMKVQKP